MSYKCGKCGATVDLLTGAFVRCPMCANKVLYKTRQPVAKEVPVH